MAYPLARAALALLPVLTLAAAPAAALPPAGGVLFVDQPTAGDLLDGANTSNVNPGGGRTLSDDGRYLVFSSDADALQKAPNPLVFRRDLTNNETVLVSTGPNGPAGSTCSSATISANGSKVAFTCQPKANLVGGVDEQAVYVRDIAGSSTEVVSRGDGLNGPVAASAGGGMISGDGTAVAFITSTALPAVGNPTDSNSAPDVYVRDGSGTHLATVAAGGNQAVGGIMPAIDNDGTAVAFVTSANVAHTNAGFPDNAGTTDVYLHERTSGDTNLISHDAAGQAGATGSSPPALSGNAGLVGWSSVKDIDAADGNGVEDVYNTTVSSDAVSLVSRQSPADGGAVGNGPSSTPSFPTGAGVLHEAFLTSATNLGADGNGPTRDVAVRSFAGPMTRVATGTAGGGVAPDSDALAPSVSGDGSRVSFVSPADNLGGPPDFFNVYVRTGADTTLVSRPTGSDPYSGFNPSGAAEKHSLSAGGRYVVFDSGSDTLSSQDDDRFKNVFRLDTKTGDLVLVTVSTGGAKADGDSSFASISADGTKVAFTSAATNLVGADANGGVTDVFVRDLSSGTTALVSRTTAGDQPPAASFSPLISADGNRVVFVASDVLDPIADAHPAADIYVRDLGAGTTQLVSRADGAGGHVLGGTVSGIMDLDADGSRIVFSTTAGDVGDGDGNTVADVHMRDVVNGATTWVSQPASGVATEGGGENPSIDAGGTIVAFDSASSTIVAEDANGKRDVFVRDLGAGATRLISEGGDAGSSSPVLSGDGRRVAFDSDAENLAGTPNGLQDVFLREARADAPVRILSEGGGAPGDGSASISDLDSSGNCALFTSRSTLFAPAVVHTTDFAHVYMRALERDCPVPPGGGPGPGGDDVAPVVKGLRLSRRRFRVGPKATAVAAAARKRAKRGTVIRFKLSERAATTLRIERARAGRRSGKRCVKPRRSLKRRCTRYVRVGTLTRAKTHKGLNRVRFSGRIARRALKVGSYRVVARARDAAGNRSKTRSARFKIVRR